MGNSLYCFYPKNNEEIKARTDLIINNIGNTEVFKRDSDTLLLSNQRTSIDSPLEDKNDIFINPIPEIVILRIKKPKRKIIYKNSN